MEANQEKPEINKPPKEILKEEPKKEGKGIKIALIICIIFALAGIGFGVYGMTKKPTEKPADNTANTELETELTDIKSKYSVLQNYVKELEASGTEVSKEVKDATIATSTAALKNPILTAGDGDTLYKLYFKSSNYFGTTYDNKEAQIHIAYVDGEIKSCQIYVENRAAADCSIGSLGGKVYKIAEAGEGQANQGNIISFIMEDGSVEYFPLYEAFDTGNFNSRGKLKINGMVTDIIENVGVGSKNPEAVGGYGTTLFVKKDGTFEKFSSSMLN